MKWKLFFPIAALLVAVSSTAGATDLEHAQHGTIVRCERDRDIAYAKLDECRLTRTSSIVLPVSTDDGPDLIPVVVLALAGVLLGVTLASTGDARIIGATAGASGLGAGLAIGLAL